MLDKIRYISKLINTIQSFVNKPNYISNLCTFVSRVAFDHISEDRATFMLVENKKKIINVFPSLKHIHLIFGLKTKYNFLKKIAKEDEMRTHKDLVRFFYKRKPKDRNCNIGDREI